MHPSSPGVDPEATEGADREAGRGSPIVDLDRPNAARMYDYYLGGSHNFAADRAAADQAARAMPELPQIMRAGRAFLRRAVRLLGANGVDQFLDLGSGIPTAGNVHEIVQQRNPEARVVYVDLDPIAVAYAETILTGNDRVSAIQADLRDRDSIRRHPETRRLINFDRPVGLLLSAVLHFVPERDDPGAVVAGFRDLLPSGSYLVISHSTQGGRPGSRMDSAQNVYRRTSTPLTPRSYDQVAALFTGFELVEPGLVPVGEWRPEPGADPAELDNLAGLAGAGRKP